MPPANGLVASMRDSSLERRAGSVVWGRGVWLGVGRAVRSILPARLWRHRQTFRQLAKDLRRCDGRLQHGIRARALDEIIS